MARGAVVLDTRDVLDFTAGHLIGALNVPADGRFAETAGMVLHPDDTIVIAAAPGGEQEIAIRLARIGFDHVLGYLLDVEALLSAHPERVQQASRLTPIQLADLIGQSNPEQTRPVVVDVRNAGERDSGYIPGSVHIPLAELARRATELSTDRPLVVHCAGGWRSSVAASLLRRTGRDDVSDLLGGYAAWQTINEFAGR